jgi:HK97 family phage portal protein
MLEKLTRYIKEKLNPAQAMIAQDEGSSVYPEPSYNYTQAYNNVPVVRRAVDLIVNGASSFDVDVTDKLQITAIVSNLRKTKVNTLLNYQPNLYIDIHKFRRLLYTDLVLEGNAFIYWDGAFLYVLPAANVEILTDPVTYVKGYKYGGTTTFHPNEIIHISDNSSTSIYSGTSRLKSTAESINTRASMLSFQANFFKNGAVPGLVLVSENVLGEKVKARMVENWSREYSPTKGAKRPIILDGGLKLDKVSDVNFRELDFADSITLKEKQILVSLGVPEILLNSGNNANLQPNLRLFYLETVLPLVTMVNSALERFFGFNLAHEASRVSALQPEMRDSASYYSTLVNGGVLAPNEARTELRYPPKPDADELRVPANIAGSAAGAAPGEGSPRKADEQNL